MISDIELENLVAWSQESIVTRQKLLPKSLATGAPWEIFQYVYRAHLAGSRLRVKEIQFGVSVPPTSTSRYIEAFEQAGLMSRAIDQQDQRASIISLSATGVAIAKEIYTKYCEHFKVQKANIAAEQAPNIS